MKGRYRALQRAFAVGVLLLMIVGCTARREPETLDGTAWRLVAWSISAQQATDHVITAQFADGQITGTSAVNSYGGLYTLGPGDAFAAGEIAQTLMAGPEPAMQAEAAYMTLLQAARSYAVEGDQLTLFDAAGNVSLVFERAG